MSSLIQDVDDTGRASRGGPGVGARVNGATWGFIRHYLEMVVAMLAGMVALGAVSGLVLDLPDRTPVEIIEMAVWMTAPMVAWMRIRGHGWRSCNEMAAAMLLPAAGALALYATGATTDSHALLMVEHTVMFPAMLVAMLVRRDEYAGHHHAAASHAT